MIHHRNLIAKIMDSTAINPAAVANMPLISILSFALRRSDGSCEISMLESVSDIPKAVCLAASRSLYNA